MSNWLRVKLDFLRVLGPCMFVSRELDFSRSFHLGPLSRRLPSREFKKVSGPIFRLSLVSSRRRRRDMWDTLFSPTVSSNVFF